MTCELCHSESDNGSSSFECAEMGYVRLITTSTPTTSTDMEESRSATQDEVLIMWQCLCGVVVLLLVLTILSFMIYYLREKGKRRNGRVSVDTSSTNMVSITTDSSAQNSLKRQSSQEQSCSSQEGEPASIQKVSTSISTFGTYFTALETHGVTQPGKDGRAVPAGERESSGKDGRAVPTSTGEGESSGKEGVVGTKGEGEGMRRNDAPIKPHDPFGTNQKVSASFPDSLGTNGLHDMLSKLGESPDPSKAGGIWF